MVRPSAPAWRFGIDTLGQATAQAAADQRRFWGHAATATTAAAAATRTSTPSPTPPLLVLLLPGVGKPHANAWHQALALQAPPELALADAAFDALLTQALVRTWVPDRFGPLVHAGRQDEALRAWFSDGFAAYYAHRLLLRAGLWTLEDYAKVLNRQIERGPDATTRGEWLALQWHGALRAQGQPGLDAVMRRLLLPAAQARREGPISAPLATHRLVAALRPVLGDAPLRDINRLAEPDAPLNAGPHTPGPCFVGQPVQAAEDRPRSMRYGPVPQAMQQPACLAWLGLGPDADARVPAQAHSAHSAHSADSADSAGQTGGRPGSKSVGKKTGKPAGTTLHHRSAKAGAKTALTARRKSPPR